MEKKISLVEKIKMQLKMYAMGEELYRLYKKFDVKNAAKHEEVTIMFYYKKVALKELVSERYRENIIGDGIWEARERIAKEYNIEDIYTYNW